MDGRGLILKSIFQMWENTQSYVDGERVQARKNRQWIRRGFIQYNYAVQLFLKIFKEQQTKDSNELKT